MLGFVLKIFVLLASLLIILTNIPRLAAFYVLLFYIILEYFLLQELLKEELQ